MASDTMVPVSTGLGPSRSLRPPMAMEARPPTRNMAVERKPACAGVIRRSRTMSGISGAWLVKVIASAPATIHGNSSDGVRSVARFAMPRIISAGSRGPRDPAVIATARHARDESRRRRQRAMPNITVQWYAGRTDQQRREITAAITEAMVKIGKTTPDQVHIVFQDVEKSHWGVGGKLASD